MVLFFVKGWAVGLVLGDADPAVTSGAVEYLTVISVLFCINGLLMVFRNTLQGLGYSVQAVISGVGELIGRALCGWLPFIVWATSASALPTHCLGSGTALLCVSW